MKSGIFDFDSNAFGFRQRFADRPRSRLFWHLCLHISPPRYRPNMKLGSIDRKPRDAPIAPTLEARSLLEVFLFDLQHTFLFFLILFLRKKETRKLEQKFKYPPCCASLLRKISRSWWVAATLWKYADVTLQITVTEHSHGCTTPYIGAVWHPS